nr:tetratricopeptide repeat protein [Oceanococcus sp. HetDA_MAG_MS8]
MDMEQTDQEQVEQLQKWWRENRLALLGGLVVGIGGLLGWEQFQNARSQGAMQASQAYEAVNQAISKADVQAADAALEQLRNEHGQSVYVAHAHAARASLAADNQNWEAAIDHLEQALASKPGKALEAVLSLRLARAQWAQGDAQAALTTLDDAELPSSASALADELRGDIAYAQGDTETARSAWESALAAGGQATAGAISNKLARLGSKS